MSPGLDLNTLETLFQYMVAAFGAFLAALWVSLAIWTLRDIRSRTQDKLIHVLATAIVTVLGPPGMVVYWILRPAHTIDEMYQRTLEEEALLSEIEQSSVCPGCGARTQTDWQICPNCHTRQRKPCHRCGRLMELPWQICPYCSTPIPGMVAESQPTNPSTPTPIE